MKVEGGLVEGEGTEWGDQRRERREDLIYGPSNVNAESCGMAVFTSR